MSGAEVSQESATENSRPLADQWLSRLLCASKWVRLFWALVYLLACYVIAMGALLLALVQWLFVLCAADKNQEINRLLIVLLGFLHDALAYVFYLRADKPFPFAPINADTLTPPAHSNAIDSEAISSDTTKKQRKPTT